MMNQPEESEERFLNAIMKFVRELKVSDDIGMARAAKAWEMRLACFLKEADPEKKQQPPPFRTTKRKPIDESLN